MVKNSNPKAFAQETIDLRLLLYNVLNNHCNFSSSLLLLPLEWLRDVKRSLTGSGPIKKAGVILLQLAAMNLSKWP